MDKYKCKMCGRVFQECEFVKTKCSENMVGTYREKYCPRCLNQRRKILSILEKVLKDG